MEEKLRVSGEAPISTNQIEKDSAEKSVLEREGLLGDIGRMFIKRAKEMIMLAKRRAKASEWN